MALSFVIHPQALLVSRHRGPARRCRGTRRCESGGGSVMDRPPHVPAKCAFGRWARGSTSLVDCVET